MLTEALLATITDLVFNFAFEEIGLKEKARLILKRDPARIAFQISLARTFNDFSIRYPLWTASLFDEHFLMHRGAPLLARSLTRNGSLSGSELAIAWAEQMGRTGIIRDRQVTALTPAADFFIERFNTALRTQPEFQSLFDSRSFDSIAASAEQSVEVLQTLHSELSRLLAKIDTLSPGKLLFQALTQASTSLNQHVRVREFQTLIEERTQEFIGRDFIFQAIDQYLINPSFPSGYIMIRGEPGIGKTALMAQIVKQHGYVHHFNIASQNIRSTHDFLANICAQLIVRYELGYEVLPPHATRDSGFLVQLLSEAAAREEGSPVVVLVDALDEAADSTLALSNNILYLPQALPQNVFFVITTREKDDYHLLVDRRASIYLHDQDLQNLHDVRQYVLKFLSTYHSEMTTQISKWGVVDSEFIELITEKSQGNFMYLVYVLQDIRDAKLTRETVDDIKLLPTGLRDYYQRHWRTMKAQDEERFEQIYEPIVCTLAVVREPVSIAQIMEWTNRLVRVDLSPRRIKEVIREWRQFLNEDLVAGGEPLYRIYHTSFQDFLTEEVGLSNYHSNITQTALDKIPGFGTG